MIVELMAQVGANFVIWLASVMPEFEIPEFMLDQRSALIDVLQNFEGLGVWVDWQVLGFCLTATSVCFVIGLSARALRAIIAHIPQFGGGGA